MCLGIFYDLNFPLIRSVQVKSCLLKDWSTANDRPARKNFSPWASHFRCWYSHIWVVQGGTWGHPGVVVVTSPVTVTRSRISCYQQPTRPLFPPSLLTPFIKEREEKWECLNVTTPESLKKSTLAKSASLLWLPRLWKLHILRTPHLPLLLRAVSPTLSVLPFPLHLCRFRYLTGQKYADIKADIPPSAVVQILRINETHQMLDILSHADRILQSQLKLLTVSNEKLRRIF